MNPTIEHNFKYHPPLGNAAEKHSASRAKAKELAGNAGREKAIAVTKCEEAMMWACAGIARHSEIDRCPFHATVGSAVTEKQCILKSGHQGEHLY